MSRRRFATALLCLGAIALCATQYLGSPWPGVVLSCLSMLPWALEAWLGRNASGAIEERLQEVGTMIDKAIVEAHRANSRLQEHEQQINSLRNSVSLRGTLGG